MKADQLKTVFTCGGCGILAQELLALRPDGVPVLWYGKEGSAVHAAVIIDGRLVHYGEREAGYKVVDRAELDEAVKYDFDCRVDEEECRELARAEAARIVSEL